MKTNKRLCRYTLALIAALTLLLASASALAEDEHDNCVNTYGCGAPRSDCGYTGYFCDILTTCADRALELKNSNCVLGPFAFLIGSCEDSFRLKYEPGSSCPWPHAETETSTPAAPTPDSGLPEPVGQEAPAEEVPTVSEPDRPEQLPPESGTDSANDASAREGNSAQTYAPDSAFVAEVIRLVNAERAAAGLQTLAEDKTLDQAAYIRSGEIISSFSHTRPDGSSCFTVLQQAGAGYTRAGENIAIGQTSPAQVVEDWMASPGHRANIMNPGFTRIGVAARLSSGQYGGYAWVQLFTD